MADILYVYKTSIYANLTNKCPCRCTFCIRNTSDSVGNADTLWHKTDPSIEEIKKAVDDFDFTGFDELVFCGYGEPTERLDDLLAVAARVKTAHPDLPVRLNTNGLSDLIAGRPTAARFKGLVDVVSVSLNAATAEEYAALCHPKFGLSAYPAILAFTREIRAYVPTVMMTVVATADFTDAKRAACEAVCAAIGVPLRVRAYLGK